MYLQNLSFLACLEEARLVMLDSRNGNEVETENGGAGQDLMNYQVLLRFHLFRKSKN